MKASTAPVPLLAHRQLPAIATVTDIAVRFDWHVSVVPSGDITAYRLPRVK
jgi:hypothetical protein